MEAKLLTEEEADLIEAIRDYKKSKHNPSLSIEIYIRRLFEDLLNED